MSQRRQVAVAGTDLRTKRRRMCVKIDVLKSVESGNK